ncbi:tubulin binding cofactor C-domain-containing protein [Mycena metata]|uniref:Tubulin binding cofactor C-domain-containing protein n=1 Tax=Mycena metata TaxID=1033252 RepID=A0AAD7NEH8_9AGAR|nr:tubulin binding cofactor C-domain-containing protein [Mycena metata]
MSNPAWSFSQTFSTQFQASRTELESRVESVKSTKITADVLQTLSVDLAKLTKTLADATGSLPSYDQRQYELQLKGLEKSLEELRTLIPKSKFAFKRKTPAPPITPVPAPTVVPEAPSTTQPESASISTNLTLCSHSLQYLSKDSLPSTSEASGLTISDLNQCILNLLPSNDSLPESSYLKISALHIRNLTDTILILPPIQGSVLIHNLRRCVLVVGCHQFRMHTSTNVNVYLSIPSTPIIEHCSKIRFAPYPATLQISGYTYPRTLSIQDFSHIKSTPSPHWSMLSTEAHILEWPVDAMTSENEIAESLGVLLPNDL